MTGTISCENEVKELTRLISSLNGCLLGNGATPGDCQKLLRNEAGHLAWEISKQLGPNTKQEGDSNVMKDARRVFFPIKPGVAASFDGKQGSRPDFLWLFATKQGPGQLVGAATEDILGDSAGDLRGVFYGANRKRGAAWQDLGELSHQSPDSKGRMRPHYRSWRGRQHAVKINRIVVTTNAFNRLVKSVKAHVGELRASFARAAMDCLSKKPIPSWVRKQIDATKANGKSIFNDAGLKHQTAPFIEFGSRAKGVTSNPFIAEKIKGAVETRRHVVFAKVKKMLDGYKYNLATGQVFKPQIREGDSE